MRAALLARGLGPEWVLVLPPFERLPHWKTDRPQMNVPWSAFFDLDALRAVVNVAEYAEFRRRWEGPIDLGVSLRLGDRPPDGSVRLGAPEPCAAGPGWPFASDAEGAFARLFGDSLRLRRLECRTAFSSMRAIAPFIVESGARTVLLDRFETLFWDESYDGAEYWRVRAGLVFAPAIRAAAERFVRARFGDEPFLAVHVRRGDFVTSGREVPSLSDVAAQVRRALHDTGLRRVFVSSDGSDEDLAPLRERLPFERYRPAAGEDVLDGVVAMTDQWIAVRAAHFIGTAGSTFSTVIMEERQLHDRPAASTFNVLCRGTPGDSGAVRFDCPQPPPRAVPR
jgi:peptide-O-fucosyltransferase